MTLGIAINILEFWPEIFGQSGEEERKEKKKKSQMRKSCIFTVMQDFENFIHMYECRDIFTYIYLSLKLQGKGKPIHFGHLKISLHRVLRANKRVEYIPTPVLFKLEFCLVWI